MKLFKKWLTYIMITYYDEVENVAGDDVDEENHANRLLRIMII